MGKRGRNSIGLILVLVILLFIFSISSLVVFGAEIDPEVEQQLESQELVDVIIVLSDNNVPELDSFEEISEDVLADMDESDFARIENEIKDQIELELIDDLNYENIDDRDDDLEGVYDSGDFKSELINSELTDETDEINELEEIEKFEESALPAIKDVLPFKEAIQEEIQKNFQKEIQKEVTEKAVEKYEDQIEERQEVIQENQQEFLSEINTGNVNELSEDQKLIPKQKKQKKSGFGLITGAVVGFFDDESSSETDLYVKRNHTLINSISGKITREGLEKLKDNNQIDKIMIDPIVSISLDESVPLINASKVWDIQFNSVEVTGVGETVCVIDTGIDYTHPDLGGSWGAKVISGYDYVNDDSDPMDDNGHGTHCGGIIAGENDTWRGVAPGANLVAIKALNSNGDGSFGDVISGIEWCIANATRYNISVISLSLGTSGWHTSSYCDGELGYGAPASAINIARSAGILVAIASGNEGEKSGISSPACIQSATAIGSTAKDDTIASYSNSAAILDLLAPGGVSGAQIYSTKNGGGYQNMYGTSMATPHAAGVVALLQNYNKQQSGSALTPDQIEEVLNQTGFQKTDSNGITRARVDVLLAIQSLDNASPSFFSGSTSDNTPAENEVVEFNISVSDAQLSQYLFSWNATGDWVNDTAQDIYGMFAELGTSKLINQSNGLVNGTKISWKFYAKDLDNRWGSSSTYSIYVNSNPSVADLSLLSSDSLNRTNGTLIGSWSYSDSNNDTWIRNETKWYLNGEEQSEYNNISMIGSGNLSQGQNWTLSVRVFDGDYWSEWSSLAIAITNNTIVWSTIPDISLVQGVVNNSLNLSSHIQFFDKSLLSFGNTQPENVTVLINQTTGMVTLTPDANFEGSNVIIFNTTDGVSTQNSNNITLTINPVNYAPILNSSIPNQSWSQDTSETINLSQYFTDLDGDSLSFSSTNPANLTVIINNNTGLVNLTPNSGFIGTRYIMFTSYDDNEHSVISNNVTLSITDGIAPTVQLISPVNNFNTSSSAGFIFNVTDNNAENLTCTLYVDGNSTGLNTVVANGENATVSHTLSSSNSYEHKWSVSCSDGTLSALSSTRNIVYDDVAPVVTLVSPTVNYAIIGNTTNFTFYYSDWFDSINCSLMIGSTTYVSDAAVVNGTNTTFSNVQISTTGTKTWKVLCVDDLENSGFTSRVIILPEDSTTQTPIFVANTPQELNATENTSLTISTSSTLSGYVQTAEYDVNPGNVSDSTANGFAEIGLDKYFRIEAESNIDFNLNWALIKIYYSDDDLDDDLNESSLKIYYLNDTSGDWQVEGNSGVNTTDNFVWANVTHFSTFSAGGTESEDDDDDDDSGSSGGSGGGGGGGSSESTTTVSKTIVPTDGGSEFTMQKGEDVTFVLAGGNYKYNLMSVSIGKIYLKSLTKGVVHTITTVKPGDLDVGNDSKADITISLLDTFATAAKMKVKLFSGSSSSSSLLSDSILSSSDDDSNTSETSELSDEELLALAEELSKPKETVPETKGTQVNHFDKKNELTGQAAGELNNSKNETAVEKKSETRYAFFGIDISFIKDNVVYILLGIVALVFVVLIDVYALMPSGSTQPKKVALRKPIQSQQSQQVNKVVSKSLAGSIQPTQQVNKSIQKSSQQVQPSQQLAQSNQVTQVKSSDQRKGMFANIACKCKNIFHKNKQVNKQVSVAQPVTQTTISTGPVTTQKQLSAHQEMQQTIQQAIQHIVDDRDLKKQEEQERGHVTIRTKSKIDTSSDDEKINSILYELAQQQSVEQISEEITNRMSKQLDDKKINKIGISDFKNKSAKSTVVKKEIELKQKKSVEQNKQIESKQNVELDKSARSEKGIDQKENVVSTPNSTVVTKKRGFFSRLFGSKKLTTASEHEDKQKSEQEIDDIITKEMKKVAMEISQEKAKRSKNKKLSKSGVEKHFKGLSADIGGKKKTNSKFIKKKK